MNLEDEQHITNNNQKYTCRDDEVRATIAKVEAVRILREVYKEEALLDNPNFDVWDQLLACETLCDASPKSTAYSKFNEPKENASVSESGNGTCKPVVNSGLTQSKIDAISKLKKCTSYSSSFEIAKYLEVLFQEYPSKPKHWLWIAQRWNPREINKSINYMLKLSFKGRIRTNPAAVVTFDVKKRAKRKNK